MIKLKNSIWISVIAGVLFGSLCALLDLMPGENIWTFSSFSGSLGFWAITGMIVLMQYEKRWKSALGTFVYFAVMNTSFFMVHFLISPLFRYPRISDFSTAITESLILLIPSAICGLCALVAFNAKKDNMGGIISLSLPIGLLIYEGICLLLSVVVNHKFLFQTIVDFIGAVILFCLFSKNKNKLLLIGISVGIGCVFVFLGYLIYGNVLYY